MDEKTRVSQSSLILPIQPFTRGLSSFFLKKKNPQTTRCGESTAFPKLCSTDLTSGKIPLYLISNLRNCTLHSLFLAPVFMFWTWKATLDHLVYGDPQFIQVAVVPQVLFLKAPGLCFPRPRERVAFHPRSLFVLSSLHLSFTSLRLNISSPPSFLQVEHPKFLQACPQLLISSLSLSFEPVVTMFYIIFKVASNKRSLNGCVLPNGSMRFSMVLREELRGEKWPNK